MLMRLYQRCRLLIIISATMVLAACLTSQTSTVAKNPVAVPTQLYSYPAQENNNQNITYENNAIPSASLAQLQNIDQKLNAGAYDDAQQQLAQRDSSSIQNPALAANIIILQTKLQLLTGHPEQALAWLNQLNSSIAMNPAQQSYVMQLRAQALYRTNQVLLSAMTDIQNHADPKMIWTKLLLVNPEALQTPTSSQTQPLITGWLQLAGIAAQNANHFVVLENSLISWQQAYPQHPANDLFSLDPVVTQREDEPKSIAVILPLSGNYARLGQTVQQGILAAYYTSPAKSQQKIMFYDTNTASMSTIYQQIKTEHHSVILGPLTKEETEDLLNIAEESPRITSLNYTNKNTPNSHFEFGLSPEDEAKQIAELAWRQGKSSAIIISTKTEKGQQTANAFIQAWSHLGGQVVDRYNYVNNDDFSTSISDLLGVTDSKWRQHLVHNTLQLHTNNTPYFRRDADMVFLIADPKMARQIRPFIKFYAGNYLSVFATSSVYSGHTDVNSDKDLNEVYFCDMPAVLHSDAPQTDRLYFVGKDAYLLAMQQSHINTLPLFPLLGSTGKLTVNTTTHDIQRELTCAQFKDGRATPLDTASERPSN
jgi:outer membrane PBP1 activator LpoA protein